ncbi:MAG: acyl carrier protein [Clostridia bacterium]|nr:acyl carrier protein [Clostridia bacterium]
MTQEKKIALLEDMLDVDEGTLTPATVLADLDEWDSLARLSLIVMMSDECDKQVTGADVRAYVTVQDILTAMD